MPKCYASGGLLTTALTTLGSPTDAADDAVTASLWAQLNAAKARIEALEEGTAPDVLDPITTAASEALTAANTASAAAGDAADAAEVADDNRATIQTGEADSISDAIMARAAATTAMEEAAKALAASDAATAAGNASAATTERDNAIAAMKAAETAKTAAETARDEAVKDAAAELKIADTVKSVGDAMVNLAASALQETVNEVTTKTGKVADLMTLSAVVEGIVGDADGPATPGVEVGREVTIGVVVDSDDDDVRVALIKSYIGERIVGGYTEGNNPRTATRPGVVSFNNDDDADLEDFRLRSAGLHFLVNGLTDTHHIEVGTEKGVPIFSFTYRPAGAQDEDDDTTLYVRHDMTTTTTMDGVAETTYTYQEVNVVKGISLPYGTDYKHIHFGVWAAVGENDDVTGDQEVSELGIAFVQNFAGGMTVEMPNNGTGMYDGNWIANIQEADADGDGAIIREDGVVVMDANFRTGKVTIELTGLADLKADIADSTFEGAEAATVSADNNYGLESTGTFAGEVSGAFFGPEAQEAGGVFDYASDDNEDGAFRGAFGTNRTDK